jgi:hypothetical protein
MVILGCWQRREHISGARHYGLDETKRLQKEVQPSEDRPRAAEVPESLGLHAQHGISDR